MTGSQTAPKHTAIIKQAVLLARFITCLRLPGNPLPSDIFAGLLPSQWRDRAGSSGFSIQHTPTGDAPVSYDE